MRRPRAVCSRWRIAEVLPATRKPVMTVAGIFPAGAPAFLEETSDIAYLPFLRCPEGEPEAAPDQAPGPPFRRSEEHTSELQSLMRISYAVFCLKKKKNREEITRVTFTLHMIKQNSRYDAT